MTDTTSTVAPTMLGGEAALGEIIIGDRARTDLGDLTDLMVSIEQVGVLQPVVLNTDYQLIAGHRRVEAVRQLGRSTIPAVFVVGLRDALQALRAQRDENTCRKPLTPSELVAIGRRIEALEQPLAADRQAATRLSGRDPSGTPVFGGGPGPTTEGRGKVRDLVGDALGVSGSTYERAKWVVDAADDPDDPAHEIAVEMREAMDAGQVSIKKAGENVRAHPYPAGADRSREAAAARETAVRNLAVQGWLAARIARELGITEDAVKAIARRIGAELIADQQLPRHRKAVDVDRVIEQAALGIEGELTVALQWLDGRYHLLDATRLPDAIRSLTSSRKLLSQLLAHLRGGR